MKEHVEVIKDSFVDFQGLVHHFTIAAVSETVVDCEVLPSDDMLDNGMYDSMFIEKGIKLGIAICNPEDTFSEKVGIAKAIGRAKNNPEYALMSTNPGYINTMVVKAFLEQEAEYLKHNPEQYILGYREKKERWEANQAMKGLGESLSPIEKTIVEELEKNPKFLDNTNKYWEWLQKQKKHVRCPKGQKSQD